MTDFTRKSSLSVARVRDPKDTVGHTGTDYPWRATVTHVAFAAAATRMVMAIDYPNFKNEVATKQGHGRAKRYGDVWSVLADLPEV